MPNASSEDVARPANWTCKPEYWTLHPIEICVSFALNTSTRMHRASFIACNTCNSRHSVRVGASKLQLARRFRPSSAIWSHPSASRDRAICYLLIFAEMNDCWPLRNIYARRAKLFRRAVRRVTARSQSRTTSEGATPFDWLANLWSDQGGRQPQAPVCRAYYILGFFVREVRRPC
jgi:hypothetical protein